MEKPDFLDKLATILDADQVAGTDVLRDFEAWDSLAILSIVAMANSDYGITLKAAELKPLITADDLYTYLEGRKQ